MTVSENLQPARKSTPIWAEASAVLLCICTVADTAQAQQAPLPPQRVRHATPTIDHRIAQLPVPDQLPELNQACSTYAQNAVADYQAMRRYPQCRVPDDPRWQASFQNHYNWCVATLAHPASRRAEAKARDAHMVECGVRSGY